MSDPRDITLGGRTFAVPALPLRANIKAYPLCVKLTNASLVDRALASRGVLDISEDELTDLAALAYLGAAAAEPGLSRDEFDALAITPLELLDAFFGLRYQTGAWVERPPAGEGEGEKSPPTSTSTES